MSDYMLLDGDKVIFMPTFGAATVVVQPGSLKASGPAKDGGKKVCIVGDEASVSVRGCMYITSSHPIPGTGTLEIAALAGDQKATKTSAGNTKVMLVGSKFTARFVVQSPAKVIVSGATVTDPTPQYSGNGNFITTNTKLKGT